MEILQYLLRLTMSCERLGQINPNRLIASVTVAQYKSFSLGSLSMQSVTKNNTHYTDRANWETFPANCSTTPESYPQRVHSVAGT